jgi:hypothetical protein
MRMWRVSCFYKQRNMSCWLNHQVPMSMSSPSNTEASLVLPLSFWSRYYLGDNTLHKELIYTKYRIYFLSDCTVLAIELLEKFPFFVAALWFILEQGLCRQERREITFVITCSCRITKYLYYHFICGTIGFLQPVQTWSKTSFSQQSLLSEILPSSRRLFVLDYFNCHSTNRIDGTSIKAYSIATHLLASSFVKTSLSSLCAARSEGFQDSSPPSCPCMYRRTCLDISRDPQSVNFLSSRHKYFNKSLAIREVSSCNVVNEWASHTQNQCSSVHKRDLLCITERWLLNHIWIYSQ